nr:MAG TPA: hypothetical protein [Crassvirales sp.]
MSSLVVISIKLLIQSLKKLGSKVYGTRIY